MTSWISDFTIPSPEEKTMTSWISDFTIPSPQETKPCISLKVIIPNLNSSPSIGMWPEVKIPSPIEEEDLFNILPPKPLENNK
mgnify:CR=1 FL=1|jgi:hypothetical protein